VNLVRGAVLGIDFPQKDALIGRALGRVVAHELVHMITKSASHGVAGVQRPGLSGRELVEASLPLSAADVDRMKEQLNAR